MNMIFEKLASTHFLLLEEHYTPPENMTVQRFGYHLNSLTTYKVVAYWTGLVTKTLQDSQDFDF